jgi:hypothetical protein
VVAFSVSLRTQEIAIRISLGGFGTDAGGSGQGFADMLADERLLLQPIECDPSGATGWPQTDSITGEFCYGDED